jgi:hypothetical protein
VAEEDQGTSWRLLFGKFPPGLATFRTNCNVPGLVQGTGTGRTGTVPTVPDRSQASNLNSPTFTSLTNLLL